MYIYIEREREGRERGEREREREYINAHIPESTRSQCQEDIFLQVKVLNVNFKYPLATCAGQFNT